MSNVTAQLMGDPEARQARPPTRQERERAYGFPRHNSLPTERDLASLARLMAVGGVVDSLSASQAMMLRHELRALKRKGEGHRDSNGCYFVERVK